MTPAKLVDETRNIGKPKNWDEEVDGPCESLSVYDYIDNAGHNIMISCWRPSEEELIILNNGGFVSLGIHGVIHPVVSLWASPGF